MFHLAFLLLAAAQDTVALPVTQAFQEALDATPELVVARQLAQAAEHRAAQSGAYPNPTLAVSAENLGAEREITGLDAPDGIEGQAVLSFALPFGGTRSGTVAVSRADRAAAAADLRLAEHGTAEEVVSLLGRLLQAQIEVEHAGVEAATMEQLSRALTLQAGAGRASVSDAARVRMAQGLAATALARREARLADLMGEVATRLGRAPDDWIVLEAARCSASPSLVPPASGPRLPEEDRAAAQLDAARGSVSLARGLAWPDLQPQVGLRRGAGNSALYLGFTTALPLFDRGSRGIAAARSRERAAETELAMVEARVRARRTAAERTVAALARAGAVFSGDWFQALEDAVTAAEARFELGEGSLFELLDSRRARLQALDDYAAWQAEWWEAQARLVRLQGTRPDASLLCTDPFRESE